MEFAARHPQRVLALTLIDITAWYGTESAQLWAQRAQLALDAGMSAIGARQVEEWLSPDFRENSPAIVQDLLERFGRTAPACFAATCVMLGTTDLRSGLARLAHPTIVIVGGEDALAPPSAAQALADAIPDAQLAVLERAQEVALLLVR